jgi:hypothetical protein
MKHTAQAMIAAAIISMAAYAATAEPSSTPEYTKSQIMGMMRTARTVDQCRALAGYFRAQEQMFEQKARSEKQEWERRSANVTGLAAKYPRPVDSSKNRYEYFTYKAQEMDRQAARFETESASAR